MKRFISSMSIIVLTAFFMVLSAQDSDFLMDERDGNIYLIKKLGKHWWMCQNLKYNSGEGSDCYNDEETNCMLKGRWYTYEAAMQSCPQGYRLPSDEDWKALEAYLGMENAELDKKYYRESGKVGKFLKVDGGTGFDAEYAGIVNPIKEDAYFDTQAYFWTSTTLDEKNAWSRLIEKKNDGINRKMIPMDYGLSVRCIKDADPGQTQEE